MDEINSLLQDSETENKIIEKLQVKVVDVPKWDELSKLYDSKKHDIVTDKIERKDKVRSDGTVDKASRIHLGLEKLAVKRMTEFAFAIPVKRVYHNVDEDEEKQAIVKAIEGIYKHARIDSENLKRFRSLFASCEICSLWYTVERENNLYGFKSKYKLKCKTYSPMDEYTLYPYFDEYDDMIAMSFGYSKTIKDEEVSYFETYTKDRRIVWKKSSADWERIADQEIKLGKIPAAYSSRSEAIYAEISHLVKELEFTLSRNSDVIAYNSAPILKVVGTLEGQESKGETRRVYRVKENGDVAYVSWQQSIEALKYHVEILLKMYFMQLQLPDLSFDSMKGLGNIGYDARQTLLSDAHLKVGDEKGALIEFLEREASVIKEFLKMMNVSWKDKIDEIDIEHIITPFIQNDEAAEINKLTKANGGKAVVSQLDSIRQLGWSSNAEETLAQIQLEDKEIAKNASTMDLFNTAD